MIQITCKGDFVTINFTTGLPISGYTFPFRFGSCNWQAALLCENVRKVYAETLKRMRKVAYDQGWKDAKAKCRKKTHFFVSDNPNARVGV